MKRLGVVVVLCALWCGAAFAAQTTSATAQYPAAVESTLNAVAAGEVIDTTWGNRLRNCIIAIETELGVDVASGSNTLLLRLAGIEAGAIDSIAIGGSTPAAGAFTTLDCTGVLNAGSGNHNLTNAAGLIDGEKVQDDTIDDDSLDFSDITGADLTLTDCAAVTSSAQIQGVTVNATTQYDLNGTQVTSGILSDVASIFMLDEDETFTASQLLFDDGVTQSPMLTFTDGADEYANVYKANQGFLTIAPDQADSGLNILTGCFKVGNGSPSTAQDGEDAYVEGTLEVDGTVNLDGTIDIDTAAEVNIDGELVCIGATGDGGTADGDNDLIVKGDFEVDGVVDFDGSVDVDATTINLNGSAAGATALVLVTSDAAGGIDVDPGTGGVDVDLDATGAFAIDGDLLCVGNAGSDGNVADGDNDLLVTGVCEIDGELECDGSADFDGAVTIDGDLTDIGGGTGGLADGDNDLLIAGDLEVDTNTNLDGDLAVDGTANLDDVDIDLAAELNIDGELVCIGTTGDGGTADGDDDLIVKGDAEVDDTLDVDGDIDLDGDGFDVDITAGFSIDGDDASNITNNTGDLTIESEDKSVIIKGDEAAADAVSIDADDAAGTGATISVGSSGGLNITGGLTDIGGGSGATADGDNDLLVAADLEVDGNTDLDGNLTGDGASVASGFILSCSDVTGTATLTAAMSGTVISNQADGDGNLINLPAVADGIYYIFVVAEAQTFQINPDDADQILGLTNAAGDSITNSTVGDHITLVACDTDGWIAMSEKGTWADAN